MHTLGTHMQEGPLSHLEIWIEFPAFSFLKNYLKINLFERITLRAWENFKDLPPFTPQILQPSGLGKAEARNLQLILAFHEGCRDCLQGVYWQEAGMRNRAGFRLRYSVIWDISSSNISTAAPNNHPSIKIFIVECQVDILCFPPMENIYKDKTNIKILIIPWKMTIKTQKLNEIYH